MSANETVIVAFLCNWCSYGGADMAGNARVKGAAPDLGPYEDF